MFDMIAGPDPDQDPGMACRRPTADAEGIEEPAPHFHFGGDTPPMSVTDYIAWIAENDAHEHAWAEQERAARAQAAHPPASEK